MAVKRDQAVKMPGGRRQRESKRADPEETKDSSFTIIDPTIRQWMVLASKGDYHMMVKMLRENSKLSGYKDFTTGYTGLHWACKHGNLDLVKLLAGTYQAEVNVKSHGGFTPLHLAAGHNHHEVCDLLVQAYRADPNIRDNAGKKPCLTNLTIGDRADIGLTMSRTSPGQLRERSVNKASWNEKNLGTRRYGSLSVKVSLDVAGVLTRPVCTVSRRTGLVPLSLAAACL